MSMTQQTPAHARATTRGSARERLLDAATSLFYTEGIHSVGIDRVIELAGVTRATMYKHFAGKEALVLAYLGREDAALRDLFAQAREEHPSADLMELLIGGIAADIRDHHRRGCPFINAAAEYPDSEGAVRTLIAEHREWFRETLTDAAEETGLSEPHDVAESLVLLRDAALVGGYLDGDERVGPAFVRTARSVVDARRPV